MKKSNTSKQVEIGPHNIRAQRQSQAVPAHASCGRPRQNTRAAMISPDVAARSWLSITGVGVEKGTKAVISVNFSVYGRRTFNNLRTNFVVEILRKGFFNSHRH